MLTVLQSVLGIARKAFVQQATGSRNFHMISTRIANAPLLTPNVVSVVPECGMKVVGKVRRRCKDCFMVLRQNILYNICKTHPRHKQQLIQKKKKNVWILTHATQGKQRPW